MDVSANGHLQADLLSAAIPELQSGVWQLISCQTVEVRKQLRKRIVFGQMAYRDELDGSARARETEIVAKVYGSDRGARSLSALCQLWQAGFCPPSCYQVPRPYGYSPEQGILLQAKAPGTTWGNLLRGDTPALIVASARAADWLLQLHQSGVRGEPWRWEDEAATIQRKTAELGAHYPQYQAQLDAAAGQIIRLLPPAGLLPVPSHGDYHPQNVFLTPEVTTVIDFDTFGPREPAFDVGYAIGQALIMSRLKLGDFAPGARAGLAFWRRYELDGDAEWSRVALHLARTFLHSLHYELRVLRNNRVDLLDVWPGLMESWLNGAGPVALEAIAVPLTSVAGGSSGA